MRLPFDALEFAFQPIVSARSGVIYAVEALVRGTEQMGFSSIPDMFDAVSENSQLRATEKLLHAKALSSFKNDTQHLNGLRLFLNVDVRVLDETPYAIDWMPRLLREAGLAPDIITLELTERFGPKSDGALRDTVLSLHKQSIKVALDDFGQGVSGLRLCFEARPDIIKIDRYFLKGVDRDPRRRVLVSSIISMAHGLGSLVVAEGIETAAELRTCQELGADLVQGFFISHPTRQTYELLPVFENVAQISQGSRRNSGDIDAIMGQMQRMPTIPVDAHLLDVLDTFRRNNESTFLPVLDNAQEPLGIVRESDIKIFAYDRYGRDLLKNKSSRHNLRAVVTRCPIIDVNARVEDLVHTYKSDFGDEGVMIVEDRKYVGFLSSRAILGIVSDRNIANARDQNPLTRLPGNKVITETLANTLMRVGEPAVLAYFDFDHFKPFNDTYGFRQGDRALVLFSELLVKCLPAQNIVIGHIGGDDFFAAFNKYELEQALGIIRELLGRFRIDIQSFYDAKSRADGFIHAHDRADQMRQFPLMRVSCAIADLRAGRNVISGEHLSEMLAETKHEAKRSSDGIATLVIMPDEQRSLQLSM